jgi:hypothetical protein
VDCMAESGSTGCRDLRKLLSVGRRQERLEFLG